jgi:hypothetical protein
MKPADKIPKDIATAVRGTATMKIKNSNTFTYTSSANYGSPQPVILTALTEFEKSAGQIVKPHRNSDPSGLEDAWM